MSGRVEAGQWIFREHLAGSIQKAAQETRMGMDSNSAVNAKEVSIATDNRIAVMQRYSKNASVYGRIMTVLCSGGRSRSHHREGCKAHDFR